jgi:hypothetical protein
MIFHFSFQPYEQSNLRNTESQLIANEDIGQEITNETQKVNLVKTRRCQINNHTKRNGHNVSLNSETSYNYI